MIWKGKKKAKKAANVAVTKGPWIWPLLWILAAVPIFFIYVYNGEFSQSRQSAGASKNTQQMFDAVCANGIEALSEQTPKKNIRRSYIEAIAPLAEERAKWQAIVTAAAPSASGTPATPKPRDANVAFAELKVAYLNRLIDAADRNQAAADKMIRSIEKVCPGKSGTTDSVVPLGIVGKFVLLSDFAQISRKLTTSPVTASRFASIRLRTDVRRGKLDAADVKGFIEQLKQRAKLDNLVVGLPLAFDIKTYVEDWKKVIKDPFSPLLLEFSTVFAGEHSQILGEQLITAGQILLVAFIPGIAGMIYRRAFWWWTLVSFGLILILYAKVTSESIEEEQFLEATIHTVIALQLVLLLIIPGLRRYASSDIRLFFGKFRVPALAYNSLLGVVFLGPALLFLAGMALSALGTVMALPTFVQQFVQFADQGFEWAWELWRDWFGSSWVSGLFFAEVLFILMPFVFVLLRRSVLWSDRRPKNIVVCFDGTTNTPDQYEFGKLAQTNVFKLFDMLKADNRSARTFVPKSFNASIAKRYENKQIAFYYGGVGNRFENNPIVQVLGGATGMGSDQVVERSYLDVMRVYNPGDRIFVFGFSRGGAIARLFAQAVEHRGSLRSALVWRVFGRNLTLFRRRNKQAVPIAVLGCWDTVGSFGIAKTIAGIDFQKIDLFKDLNVANNVEQAYHLVALDERRKEFRPTLMDPDPTKPERIIEVWFSGDHANIGGGWATTKLSDVTLDFMLRQVSSGYAKDGTAEPGKEDWGVYLSAYNGTRGGDDDAADAMETAAPAEAARTDVDGNEAAVLYPDAKGQLRQWHSDLYEYVDRELPYHAVISETVFERMRKASPLYAPQSLFNHHRELNEKRKVVSAEIDDLAQTQSVTAEERDEILRFRDQLNVTRFDEFLDNLVKIIQPRKLVPPAETLNNAFHDHGKPRDS